MEVAAPAANIPAAVRTASIACRLTSYSGFVLERVVRSGVVNRRTDRLQAGSYSGFGI